ncbi:MAG: HAMP domain-containing histidine kinase [Deltaproteobacteria bacterium]|nr:HAMP domain-containing histidine kinase [Deltaproteobacteria bacterium]
MSRLADARARMAAAVPVFDRILHDLKQPLNSIRVAAQDVRLDLRKNRLDPASLPDTLVGIEGAVDELARRIDLLRRFANPGSREPAAASEIANACRAASARVRAAHSELAIEESLDEQPGRVALEPADLEQVIWELLDNAAHASSDGPPGAKVQLRTFRRGESVGIAVSDQGPGVPEDQRERIFEPFVALRPGGSGLGLAIARALVMGVDGSVACLDNGGGALFEVLLPSAR